MTRRRLGPTCADVLDTVLASVLPCTTGYVRDETGRTHREVYDALRRLERRGLVVRAGSVPTCAYWTQAWTWTPAAREAR